MATLLSVNVGRPKDVAWEGRTVFTGIWKQPVDGPRLVRRLNIDGDGQGDLNGHGGEQRAVMVYQLDSYRHWEQHLGREPMEFGQFGENFTVDGLGDDEVHIGDRYRIGDAEFEVTQPRVTCFRVGMRLGEPQMPALLVAHHRPGFYLRVITEGHVRAGDDIVRTQVGRHALSVAAIDELLYLPGRDLDTLRLAVDVPPLSPGWQQSFRELLDSAERGTAAVAPTIGVEPGWPGFRPFRVTRLVPETQTVISVYLTAEPRQPLPHPRAGQYLTIRVADAAAAGDPPPVRNYSLSSAPDADGYRISVKLEPHGLVSGYLNTVMRAGSILDVAAPRGTFVLSDESSPLLLISAGIGVTPVLAMLHQLATQTSERDVWWIHTARNAAEHAFAAEAHRLLEALPFAHEHVYYTAPDIEPPAGTSIRTGRLNAAVLASLALPRNGRAYICGPAAFMTDVQAALVDLGVAPDHVHTEVFGTLAAINPGVTDVRDVAPHQPPGPPGAGPEITFARSGLAVRWSDRHGSLLELADACDVPTRYSCRTGVCHTCVTPVLSGAIAYAPEPLERPQADEALICCARPRGDVVLDL